MSGYLKRYMMPAFVPMSRKMNKWVSRPRAGPHAISLSIPLSVVVRDGLKLTDNIPETKKVIKAGNVLVDKKKRTDIKYPVGFMDVIEIPAAKKSYRVMLNEKGLYLEEIKESDSAKKICIIKNKKILKGRKTQLCLHDGRTIIVPKDEYRIGESIIISLPDQKIAKHFKFEKGSDSFIISGKNKGFRGKIKEIKEKKTMLDKSMVRIESKEGELSVPKKYVMVGAL